MPATMGQLVSVREKPSSTPGVVRYEINRSLTGMGHERYGSLEDIVLDRPVDAVARRLFEHGGVQAVHVNSSVITVYLSGGSTGEGIAEVIENLFRFYGEEDAEPEVASPDEPQAQEPPTEEAPADSAAEVVPAETSDAGVDSGEVDGDVPEA